MHLQYDKIFVKIRSFSTQI